MTLAEAVHRLKFPGEAGLPAALCVTDTRRMADPLSVLRRLPPGTGVLFRHYDAPDRAALARQVARLARSRRLVLLVAGDWRLAAGLDADGVHLPEGLGRSGLLAPIKLWARTRGRLITMASHSPGALAAAGRLGADAALLSPVFPTASHPGAPVIGAVRFRLWRRRARVAVYALGGVTLKNWPQTGGAGLAALSGW